MLSLNLKVERETERYSLTRQVAVSSKSGLQAITLPEMQLSKILKKISGVVADKSVLISVFQPLAL